MRTRIPSTRFAAATLALTSALTPSLALAAEPGPDTVPITVVTVQSNEADDQAEALTKALRNAVRTMPGWSLGTGDYSLEVLALSLKCPTPPDANCQSRLADQMHTDRFVWGTLKKSGANVTGAVHFWVRGRGTTDYPLEYTANLLEANDDALKKIATDAIYQITGGPPKGSVHVHAIPGAQAFADGAPLGAVQGDGAFLLPAGPHVITVKAPGYVDAEARVVVSPNTPVDVRLAPVEIGAANGTNLRRYIGLSSIGAGVVFAIIGFVGIGEVASAQSSLNSVRGTMPANSGFDWCSPSGSGPVMVAENNPTVTSACTQGHTFQVVQGVFFPLAAIAAGVGTYLVVTSGKRATPPTGGLSVSPSVGLKTGNVAVTYTF